MTEAGAAVSNPDGVKCAQLEPRVFYRRRLSVPAPSALAAGHQYVSLRAPRGGSETGAVWAGAKACATVARKQRLEKIPRQ
jgi:hypothetical protein